MPDQFNPDSTRRAPEFEIPPGSADQARLTSRSQEPWASVECEADAIAPGKPNPLGAHSAGKGVNFAVFTRHASSVSLELYNDTSDQVPERSYTLDLVRNKTGDIWHIWLANIKHGQLYGFRID